MIFGFLVSRAFKRYIIYEWFRSNNFQPLLYLNSLRNCLTITIKVAVIRLYFISLPPPYYVFLQHSRTACTKTKSRETNLKGRLSLHLISWEELWDHPALRWVTINSMGYILQTSLSVDIHNLDQQNKIPVSCGNFNLHLPRQGREDSWITCH